MPENASDFGSLLMKADRAISALDDFTRRDGSRATAQAVSDGVGVYSHLLEYQRTAWMTAAENSAVQSALDMLKARLRFFGQSV